MSEGVEVGGLSREEWVDLVIGQRRFIDSLTAQVAALQAENARLRSENEALRASVVQLRKEIGALKRESHRSAAPFSKGQRVAEPKRPGRKQGEGPFTYRKPPDPEAVTERVEVPVRREACPACGGRLVLEKIDLAWNTELPERPKPVVVEYRVEVCRCEQCGGQVRGEHPAVAPDQFGATAHRLGPRLRGAAHELHYGVGIPERKVPGVLELLTGVEVTQGALSHDALRQAEAKTEGSIGKEYETLRESVKEAEGTHTDDTGWNVGGDRAFLMVFETEDAVVYQIRERHRNEEVRELIPGDYKGVLICDRGPSYDAEELAGVRQQKCLRHIDRDLSETIERREKEGRIPEERAFPEELRTELRAAHALWNRFQAGEIDRETYDREGARLRGAITGRLAHEHRRLADLPKKQRTEIDRDNRRLLAGIGRYQYGGDLLRFLTDPRIEPTNNRAERAIRPAVISRKVSHCSESWRGAKAFEAWTSVLRTRAKRAALRAIAAGHRTAEAVGALVADFLASRSLADFAAAHPPPLLSAA